MNDIEKLLKAMECSLRPCREKDDCKECKYRFLEKVDDRFPRPPDVEENGIKYWESCDCDGMVKDAIQTIRELQAQNKYLLEDNAELHDDIQSLNVFYHEGYEEGYAKGGSDMEKAKQIIIDKLQEQIPKWHLCTEELPNESGEYLCYVNYDGNKFYNIEEIDCDGFFKEWNISGKVKVIAWTELPKFESEE